MPLEWLDFERMDPLGFSTASNHGRSGSDMCDTQSMEKIDGRDDGDSSTAATGLISELTSVVGSPHLILTTPGWDATSRAIRGLVRPRDHIVLDAGCDNEILVSAMAATRQIHIHAHADIEDVRRRLARIRARDPDNAILVVTSTLFATTSRIADLEALREAARAFCAFVLVDVSNDLGIVLPNEGDPTGRRAGLDAADVVTGNLSATLAADLGFISCRARAAATYLRWFRTGLKAADGVSSNQAAIACATLRFVRSPEGRARRARLAENVLRLRSSLQESGLTPLGIPSWIASIAVDRDDVARLAFKRATTLGALVELVESASAVRSSGARLRLYVSSEHDRNQLARIGPILARAIQDARCDAEKSPTRSLAGDRGVYDASYVDV